MFDTYVTIVGNVLTAPEWRRTTQSNTLVANFKVASTARRLDRESGRWVDGNSLRVRVNCWRKLAEGVAASVAVGDPVVVAGRLYTRDWTDDAGNHRTLYELEAVAVGHDLSRGRARFLRNRPSMTTSSVDDAEAERRVHGEATAPVSVAQAPVSFDDRPFDDEFPPEFDTSRVGLSAGTDPAESDLDELADPFDERPDLGAGQADLVSGREGLAAEVDEPAAGTGAGAVTGRRGAERVAGEEGAEAVTDEPEPAAAPGVTGPGRPRRGRGRAPVPA
ncbi:single-stranded DNA-binding protein [Micromonospora chaiyaphumensis]|uniref:Single-stranded DNA-binding protein n=1 Tax=Micromonospora chaiyaphumensis TaxID=307119 RepID=A0A1C4ZFD9_9ACTN|nr:single-stranded DNA-binding protein [Micromonospora chaiyaphumensis]SCF31693.1 single-strand DNA-binding protein [Micromonospora chaiyaphumensis]